MKTMIKRIFAAVLAIAVLFSLSAGAFAEKSQSPFSYYM